MLSKCLSDPSWRIRQASVRLLGELLLRLANVERDAASGPGGGLSSSNSAKKHKKEYNGEMPSGAGAVHEDDVEDDAEDLESDDDDEE